MLAFWSTIQAIGILLFIWIMNSITSISTETDPSSLLYTIVTNDTIDEDRNDQIETGNTTQLENKFNKNINLTSSDSMMNLFELMMPQYLLSNSPGLDHETHFHQHQHHGHRHPHHHHHHHLHNPHTQPDIQLVAPALIDPDPLLVSTEPNRQTQEVQLIIDYYNQLYNNDQPRTFPFTTPALEQFQPTVSYSLDEFSSFMPNYQNGIFPTTNETPCSLEKSAENYAKTKIKSPTKFTEQSTDDETDCGNGKEDDNDDHNETSEENSDDNNGGGGQDDDDTPLPYDPFEYLNHYRKAIPNSGESNHNDETDSKPDDGNGGDSGGADEEENNNNDDNGNDQQPSKDGEDNGDGEGNSGGGSGDNSKDVDVDDKPEGSGTNDNDNDSTNNGGEDPEPEPETNDTNTDNNLIDLDTKTARKNEPNDWEPKDDDDFDQDESSTLPIRMDQKELNNSTVQGDSQEIGNRTKIRTKRSLAAVIDQLRMVNDQFNQIDSMDPIHDLHPSSSRSMLPNLMPYARRPSSPLSLSSANLLGSPNYFDYWNQASIQNSRANANWKHHLRHHPNAGLRFSNQPHRNHYHNQGKKSMFLKNQAYPYMKLRQKFYTGSTLDRRPVPTVYSELDEIHNQQKAIHDSFRNGELLLPRGYEDPDHFQPPPEQFQYPPGPMSPEFIENENPDAPTEEEYDNEDETLLPQRPPPLQPEPNYYDENMSFDGQVVANPNEDYQQEQMMIRSKPFAYKSAQNGYFNARFPVPRKQHKSYRGVMQSNNQLYGF